MSRPFALGKGGGDFGRGIIGEEVGESQQGTTERDFPIALGSLRPGQELRPSGGLRVVKVLPGGGAFVRCGVGRRGAGGRWVGVDGFLGGCGGDSDSDLREDCDVRGAGSGSGSGSGDDNGNFGGDEDGTPSGDLVGSSELGHDLVGGRLGASFGVGTGVGASVDAGVGAGVGGSGLGAFALHPGRDLARFEATFGAGCLVPGSDGLPDLWPGFGQAARGEFAVRVYLWVSVLVRASVCVSVRVCARVREPERDKESERTDGLILA